MEFLDLAGLVPSLRQPGLYVVSFGISDQEGLLRILILSIFSLSIGVSSLLTAIGIFRRKSYSHLTAGLIGILFISYGLYQITSTIIQMTNNQIGVIAAGIMYILLGVIAAWLGNQTKLSIQDKPRQR
jgi:hypothetical protein